MKKAVTCAQCGTKMRPGIKFCSKCGYRLKDAEAEARAAAAQAEEAAANFLTEEEIATLRAAETAPEVEEVVEAEVAEEAGPSQKQQRIQERAEANKLKAAEAHENAMYRQRIAAEEQAAKRAAKTEAIEARNAEKAEAQRQRAEDLVRIEAAKAEAKEAAQIAEAARRAAKADAIEARTTAQAEVEQKRAEEIARVEAAKVEKRRADAVVKAARKAAETESRAQAKEEAAAKRDAKRAAKADALEARTSARAAEEQKRAEEIARVEAAKVEKRRADAAVKVARKNADAENKAQAREAAENKRVAKQAALESKRNFEANVAIDRLNAGRAATEERQAIAKRSFESRVEAMRQNSELQLARKSEKETVRRERIDIAEREAAARKQVKSERSLAKTLHKEEKKAAKQRRAEAAVAVAEKRAENRLNDQRISLERAQMKQRVAADEKVQSTRLGGELKNAKKSAAENLKQTRAMLSAEAEAERHRNLELKKAVEEKEFENRLNAKQDAADRKARKLREADIRRVAAKQQAIRQSATKKLGQIEYKSAAANVDAETAETRRKAQAAEREMQERIRNEKAKAREEAAAERLERQNARTEERIRTERANSKAKVAKRVSDEKQKQNRILLNEEAKIALRENNELKRQVQDTVADNRTVATRQEADEYVHRRGLVTQQRIASKESSLRVRAARKVGDLEYKTAMMSPEIVDARLSVKKAREDKDRIETEQKLRLRDASLGQRVAEVQETADLRSQDVRISGELKAAKKSANAKVAATRKIAKTDVKIAKHQNDFLDEELDDKRSDLRTLDRQASADHRARLRRSNDIQRAASAQNAVTSRELKKLGAAERRAAKNLAGEASEIRAKAIAVEQEDMKQRGADALQLRDAKASRKLIQRNVKSEKRSHELAAGGELSLAKSSANIEHKNARSVLKEAKRLPHTELHSYTTKSYVSSTEGDPEDSFNGARAKAERTEATNAVRNSSVRASDSVADRVARANSRVKKVDPVVEFDEKTTDAVIEANRQKTDLKVERRRVKDTRRAEAKAQASRLRAVKKRGQVEIDAAKYDHDAVEARDMMKAAKRNKKVLESEDDLRERENYVDKSIVRINKVNDRRSQLLRLGGSLGAAKKAGDQQVRRNRRLARADARIALHQNDDLRNLAIEKRNDARLLDRMDYSARRKLKIRARDVEGAVVKRNLRDRHEIQKLGHYEKRAAGRVLSDDARAARSLNFATRSDMLQKLGEQKVERIDARKARQLARRNARADRRQHLLYGRGQNVIARKANRQQRRLTKKLMYQATRLPNGSTTEVNVIERTPYANRMAGKSVTMPSSQRVPMREGVTNLYAHTQTLGRSAIKRARPLGVSTEVGSPFVDTPIVGSPVVATNANGSPIIASSNADTAYVGSTVVGVPVVGTSMDGSLAAGNPVIASVTAGAAVPGGAAPVAGGVTPLVGGAIAPAAGAATTPALGAIGAPVSGGIAPVVGTPIPGSAAVGDPVVGASVVGGPAGNRSVLLGSESVAGRMVRALNRVKEADPVLEVEERPSDIRSRAKAERVDLRIERRRARDARRVEAKKQVSRLRAARRRGRIERNSARYEFDAIESRNMVRAARRNRTKLWNEARLGRRENYADKSIVRINKVSDRRSQLLRLDKTLTANKIAANQQVRRNRRLARADARILLHKNDELRREAIEKRFDASLLERMDRAERRNLVVRARDVESASAKRYAVDNRELKDLGRVEKRAAKNTLSETAAKARTQRLASSVTYQQKRGEEKLQLRDAEAAERLVTKNAKAKARLHEVVADGEYKIAKKTARNELSQAKSLVKEKKELAAIPSLDGRKEIFNVELDARRAKDALKTEKKIEAARMEAVKELGSVERRSAKSDASVVETRRMIAETTGNDLGLENSAKLSKRAAALGESVERVRATGERRALLLRSEGEIKAAAKVASAQIKSARTLAKANAKVALHEGDAAEIEALDRLAENRVLVKNYKADRKLAKIRTSSALAVADKTNASDKHEVKALAKIEKRAAKKTLSATAAEARTKALAAETETKKQIGAEKLQVRDANAANKLAAKTVKAEAKVHDIRATGEYKAAKKRAGNDIAQAKSVAKAEKRVAGIATVDGQKQVFESKVELRRAKDARRAEKKIESARYDAVKKLGSIERKSAKVDASVVEARLAAKTAARNKKALVSAETLGNKVAATEKSLQRITSKSALKVQKVRAKSDLRTAGKLASAAKKNTKALAKVDSKVALHEGDAVRLETLTKKTENKVLDKNFKAGRKLAKVRSSSALTVADKTNASNLREVKKLGKIEKLAAKKTLTDVAAEAHTKGIEVANASAKKRGIERLENRNADAMKRLINRDNKAKENIQNVLSSSEYKSLKKSSSQALSQAKSLAKEKKRLSEIPSVEAQKQIFEQKIEVRRAKDARRLEKKIESARMDAVKKLSSVERKAAKVDPAVLEARAMANTAAHNNRSLADDEVRVKRDAAVEKSLLRLRSTTDRRSQLLRADSEIKAAKKVSAAQLKQTRILASEEAKIAQRPADLMKDQAETKAFDNRLYDKKLTGNRKIRKRRESDQERVLDKMQAVEARETRKLGSIEYKAASRNLTPEAAEARRLAMEAELNMQRQQGEERVKDRRAKADNRIERKRAANSEKLARIEISQLEKAEKNYNRAEIDLRKTAKTEKTLDVVMKADNLDLENQRKSHEQKLYEKKLRAERRLNKRDASNKDKLQKLEIDAKKTAGDAKALGESLTKREALDLSARELNVQKNKETLYERKKSSDEDIFAREHKLARRDLDATTAQDKRLMSLKEKEQKKNRKLLKKYQKEKLKRAKAISKISGVPVSTVSAMAGESMPYALPAPGMQNTAALAQPELLLENSYESNRAQFLEFKKRKRQEENRLRYVAIGVHNDKRYCNTIYENGECLVAKRTVRTARVQSILAIFLMVAALVACFMPFYRVEQKTLSKELYDIVLDGVGVISFESMLTDKASGAEDVKTYFEEFKSHLSSDFVGSATNGLTSFADALTQSNTNDSFLTHYGAWVVLALTAIGMILTPVIILVNLVIAILRFIFRGFGHTVAVTRVMKNLRASYTFLGLMLLPGLFMEGVTFGIGSLFFAATFAASIVLMYLLDFFKKYEKGDRKYLAAVRIGGLVRLAILLVFLVVVRLSGLFAISAAGDNATMRYVAFGCFGLAALLIGFSARAITSLGFEVIGYTKGRSTKHNSLVIYNLIACVLAFLPTILLPGVFASNLSMVLVAAVVMVAFLVVTFIIGIVKRSIVRRNHLIDPILHAIGEGYPLK